jgi:hypothetical protein
VPFPSYHSLFTIHYSLLLEPQHRSTPAPQHPFFSSIDLHLTTYDL